jgi:hypothetical protein
VQGQAVKLFISESDPIRSLPKEKLIVVLNQRIEAELEKAQLGETRARFGGGA